MLWYILIGIILFLLLLLVTPLQIKAVYKRAGKNDFFEVTIKIWRVIPITFKLPSLKLAMSKKKGPYVEADIKAEDDSTVTEAKIDTADVKQVIERFQQMLERVHNLMPIMKNFFRHISCQEIEWKSTLGIGDAAGTGALIGLVYGVKCVIISMLSHNISLHRMPRINVEPAWNTTIIRTQFHCIVEFRIGYVILTGIRMLLKLRRGRVRKWQTTPFRV